jgi:hypothetical protein
MAATRHEVGLMIFIKPAKSYCFMKIIEAVREMDEAHDIPIH